MITATYNNVKPGSLEVICGPMFSGKSEELMRRLRRATIAKQSVGVFKHALDTRVTTKQVVSHNGNTMNAYATDASIDIERLTFTEHFNVVGIDEVQFFEPEIIRVIIALVNAGKRVIVAGLDTDFRRVPFGPMPTLLAIADSATKLHAICTVCGADAMCTQRLVDGKPAKHDDPIILIGAQQAYQARCRTCFVIDHIPHPDMARV